MCTSTLPPLLWYKLTRFHSPLAPLVTNNEGEKALGKYDTKRRGLFYSLRERLVVFFYFTEKRIRILRRLHCLTRNLIALLLFR